MIKHQKVTPRQFVKLARLKLIVLKDHWNALPDSKPHRIILERRELVLDDGTVIYCTREPSNLE